MPLNRWVRWVQKALRWDQIHIVGCARSGTTLVQFSMVAFKEAVVVDRETRAEYPRIRALLEHTVAAPAAWQRRVLVTKRGYQWHADQQMSVLLQRARGEGLGILYVMRDPRDVLSSVHGADGAGKAYLAEQRWCASIDAGERLVSELQGEERLSIVRYEDLIAEPVPTQESLMRRFGLTLRPGISTISALSENVRRANYRVPKPMVAAMHTLRAFDPASIGRWRTQGGNPLDTLQTSEARSLASHVMEKYGYV